MEQRPGVLVFHRWFPPWMKLVWASIFCPVVIPFIIYRCICSYFTWIRMKKLQGKVVLITGASSGLGEALAHRFYRAGCRIILASRRKDELERVREDIVGRYKTSPTYPPSVLVMDLSNISSLHGTASAALQICGHVDILVNNGGVSFRGEATNTSVDIDMKVMAVNYFGTIAFIKAMLPSMIERRSGHIVAISSVQGKIALPQRSAYGASKHALQAFCDSLRAEVSTHGIRVTVVSPSYIRTNLSVNAVTADGGTYGVMDATTASGMSADDAAEQIVKACCNRKSEVILATLSPRLALMIRYLWPRLYFWIMSNRAKRLSPAISAPPREKSS